MKVKEKNVYHINLEFDGELIRQAKVSAAVQEKSLSQFIRDSVKKNLRMKIIKEFGQKGQLSGTTVSRMKPEKKPIDTSGVPNLDQAK